MDVAGALRRLAAGQVAGALVGQHGHAYVQQRQVDVLALAAAAAGVVARMQGGQDGAAGVHAGEKVDHGHPHTQGAAAGLVIGVAGDAHEPAHGLYQHVVAGTRCIGSGLAEPGDRAVDQARVEAAQAGVVQAIACQASGLEVFHQHVALAGQFADEFLALGRGHVHGDRALVAVAGGEVTGVVGGRAGSVGKKGRAPVARVVTLAGFLDLDHIGPHVGQVLGAPGTGEHAREVEYAQVAQRRLALWWGTIQSGGGRRGGVVAGSHGLFRWFPSGGPHIVGKRGPHPRAVVSAVGSFFLK